METQASPWEPCESGTTVNLWGIAHRAAEWGIETSQRTVVVGEAGVILTSDDDGKTWSRRDSGTRAWLTAATYVAYMKLFFVVGADGVILSSSDGIFWRRESSPTTARLNGVAGMPEVIAVDQVAVGAVGEPGVGLLTRGANGVWTQSDPGFGQGWMRGLTNLFVTGQGGALFALERSVSVSKETWRISRVAVPVSADLEAVSIVSSLYARVGPVVVGAEGTILQGGVLRDSGTRERLRGVCHRVGGNFVFTTAGGRLAIGEFFVVGTGGTILRSADGVSWRRDVVPVTRNLNSVVAASEHVIAVGDGGAILRSGGTRARPVIVGTPMTGVQAGVVPYAEAVVEGDGAKTWLWAQDGAGVPVLIGNDQPRQLLWSISPSLGLRGGYTLWVVNGFGWAMARFTPHRFLNFAARGSIGPGGEALIGGFTIGGAWGVNATTRRVLIRAAGPSLARFGVPRAHAAPRLSVFAGAQRIATNAGWGADGKNTEIKDAFRRAGAFPFPDGSEDSALLLTLPEGTYTAQVTSDNGLEGEALVEVYVLDEPARTRLVNLSSRGWVRAGMGPLIGGLVIEGGVPSDVLVRAAGPSLAAFGVRDALARPRLAIFKDGVEIASNQGWEANANAAAIEAMARKTQAFAFPAGGADAALLLSLGPGAYTLHVTGVDGGAGEALLEIYETP